MTAINIPDILKQFLPATSAVVEVAEDRTEIPMAQVGGERVVVDPNETVPMRRSEGRGRMFESVQIPTRKGPLMIYDKRWYFRLVPPRADEYQRGRALMQDYPLNQIVNHLVICFTPDQLPGAVTPFRKQNGDPIRIYAYFDCYLEFFDYMQKFDPSARAFYEIIFGELPQKPHFDIDIDLQDFTDRYPGEDIDAAAELLREAVILGCLEVLADSLTPLDLQRDVLIYSSHSPDKRSYHIILNNKCHDGNKESKAFYDAVMAKVRLITGGKYLVFVDASVYSPRQQFRLVGCQKQNSDRPKVFYEEFWFRDQKYTHIYSEDVTNPTMKKLTIIYESMVGFTSGCVLLPSLVPPRPLGHSNLGEVPDVDRATVDYCLNMLREKMPNCPFSLLEIRGRTIYLKRHGPSSCPICQNKIHEKENPFLYISGGKVYWDCRRWRTWTETPQRFLIGYIGYSIDEIKEGHVPLLITNDAKKTDEESSEDEAGQFMFGDFDLGAPTMPPMKRSKLLPPPPPPEKLSPQPEIVPPSMSMLTPETALIDAIPTINIPPPEYRQQNVESNLMKIAKSWAERRRVPRRAKELAGTFETIKDVPTPWTPGYQ